MFIIVTILVPSVHTVIQKKGSDLTQPYGLTESLCEIFFYQVLHLTPKNVL